MVYKIDEQKILYLKLFTSILFIAFIIFLYLGAYYLISKALTSKIIDLIGKTNKYAYIIGIICKFAIFFSLLKLILETMITTLFFDFKDETELNKTIYETTQNLATAVSILFFIMYEFIIFPVYFIKDTDALISLIVTFMSSMVKNPQLKLDLKKTNFNIKTIENDILGILDKGYNIWNSDSKSFILGFIQLFLDKPNLDINESIEYHSNSVASRYAGMFASLIIILGLIYVAIVYYVGDKLSTLWKFGYLIIIIILLKIFGTRFIKKPIKFMSRTSRDLMKALSKKDIFKKIFKDSETLYEQFIKDIKDYENIGMKQKIFRNIYNFQNEN